MRTVVSHDSCACQSVIQAGCAKMTEWIDVLFGMETPGDPRNIVLDEAPHPPMARGRGYDAAFV